MTLDSENDSIFILGPQERIDFGFYDVQNKDNKHCTLSRFEFCQMFFGS